MPGPPKPRQSPRCEVIDGAPCVWIPLTQNKWALIDEADFQAVNEHVWHCVNGYACREVLNQTIFLHQVICPVPDGMMPDHVGGNKLDNRRHKLRPVTKAQNGWNAKLSKRNTSGHKGVKSKCGGRWWQAEIFCNGKYRYLGMHTSKDDAIAARVKAEKELFGDYRRSA